MLDISSLAATAAAAQFHNLLLGNCESMHCSTTVNNVKACIKLSETLSPCHSFEKECSITISQVAGNLEVGYTDKRTGYKHGVYCQ